MDATSHRIHLAIGNRTVRRRMRAILEEATLEEMTLEVVEVTCGEDSESEEADLLIADLDSHVPELESLVAPHRARERHLIWTGLEPLDDARIESGDVELARPFSPDRVLERVRYALGIAPDGETSEDAGGNDESGSHVNETSKVMELDEASSMVLDVEDLSDTYIDGGRFVGSLERQSLDIAELRAEASSLASTSTSDSTRNPTMPEVPTSRGEASAPNSEPSEQDASRPSRPSPDETPRPGAGASPRSNETDRSEHSGSDAERRSDSTGGEHTETPTAPPSRPGAESSPEAQKNYRRGEDGPPSAHDEESRSSTPTPPSRPTVDRRGSKSSVSSSAPLSPELDRRIAEGARLLAEHWDRLGLTARRDDRADRIERVLTTLLRRGRKAARGELDRLPPSRGFSGRLEMLSFTELLRIVRRHSLRGRLEVSSRDEELVFYIDAGQLDEVEDLHGRGDLELLDGLLESGELERSTHRRLRDDLEEAPGPPLEMRLRTEELVSREGLEEARCHRAERILRRALELEHGNFAFIRIRTSKGGQAWPVEPLALGRDSLLLEWWRETGWSDQMESLPRRTELMTVEDRARRLDSDRLTPLESEVLDICLDLQTLGQLERRYENDDVVEAIHRLECVGLLARVGEAPTEWDEAHGEDGMYESPTSSIDDEVFEQETTRPGDTPFSSPEETSESTEVPANSDDGS